MIVLVNSATLSVKLTSVEALLVVPVVVDTIEVMIWVEDCRLTILLLIDDDRNNSMNILHNLMIPMNIFDWSNPFVRSIFPKTTRDFLFIEKRTASNDKNHDQFCRIIKITQV